MKQIIKACFITAMCATLFSCGASNKTKISEEVKKELSLESQIKEITNQTTTIKFDTTVTVKGNFILAEIDYKEFISGKDLVTEDERQKTKTYFDKKENKVKTEVTIKDMPVKIKAEKITDIKKEIVTNSKLKQTSETKVKVKEKVKEASVFLKWWFWVLILILIIAIAYAVKWLKKWGIMLFIPALIFFINLEIKDKNMLCNINNILYLHNT